MMFYNWKLYTWESYFLKQILKTFFIFLFAFYGLYILIDYASHLSGSHYHHSQLKIGEFFLHYIYEFSIRAEILIPFGLLIATIYTLTKLNANSELAALLAGGFSIHLLARPFLFIGLCAVLLLYFNHEFIEPKAYLYLNTLNQKYITKRFQMTTQTRANAFYLNNNSLLIYKEFDHGTQTFNEVYWVPSFDKVWRMESLRPYDLIPTGFGIDYFERENGHIVYKTSFETKAFENLQFDPVKLQATLITPDEQKLSALISELAHEPDSTTEKYARNLTALSRKMTLPWLALIVILAIAPFCIRFSRSNSTLLIFAGGIFGLVALYLLLNALSVLSERQVLTPFYAIILPFLFIFVFFMYRFIRMRT